MKTSTPTAPSNGMERLQAEEAAAAAEAEAMRGQLAILAEQRSAAALLFDLGEGPSEAVHKLDDQLAKLQSRAMDAERRQLDARERQSRLQAALRARQHQEDVDRIPAMGAELRALVARMEKSFYAAATAGHEAMARQAELSALVQDCDRYWQQHQDAPRPDKTAAEVYSGVGRLCSAVFGDPNGLTTIRYYLGLDD